MNAGLPSSVAGALRRSPFRHAAFRLFYAGSIASALGYQMQATLAAWLMATLTPSALMVALVQSASTAPSLLFGLIAGSLADIVDRRRVIMTTTVVLAIATMLLGGATLAGYVVPATLLGLTFLVGSAFSVYMPAQQASVNDLVQRAEVPRAVALNAVAFNLARAVGPGLAGALAAWLSTGSALTGAGLLFGVMILACVRWKRPARTLPGVPETIFAGVKSGLRYARHSPLMRPLIARNLAFSVSASALWALLPVIARDLLGLGAGGFGLLSASFGTGAVVSALSIPRHLQRMSLHRVVTVAALVWISSIALIAASSWTALALVGMFGAGMAWVGVLASLSAGVQSAAPAWVRARAVAMNLVAFQAMLAFGSAAWGIVASLTSIRVALAASAAAMALLLLTMNRKVRVRLGEDADVLPVTHMPALGIDELPSPDEGPVLIQVEYRIPPENRTEFMNAIHALEPTRRRNGASDWRVFRDLSDERRFVERYIIDSWAEYERLRGRTTLADRKLHQHVSELQEPGTEPRISRFIGLHAGERPPTGAPV